VILTSFSGAERGRRVEALLASAATFLAALGWLERLRPYKPMAFPGGDPSPLETARNYLARTRCDPRRQAESDANRPLCQKSVAAMLNWD